MYPCPRPRAVWSRDLGALKRVHVAQLADGEASDGGKEGWYLDKIIVTGPGRLRWRFPCAAWLGTPAESEGTGE